MLRHVPALADPRVLVDAASRDDAAVFRLSPDRAVVATVDFFTPIVDDPAAWGAVAAANALSDVYAMGATPLFGLNLVGWPRDTLPLEMLGEVLEGAAEVTRRAGCLVLGGHSVTTPSPSSAWRCSARCIPTGCSPTRAPAPATSSSSRSR